MGTPGKPWKADYAKSSRALCRTCNNRITKELLRFGKMVQSSQFDGRVRMWNHDTCILRTANQIKSLDDVEGIYSLRWEDQEMIKKYIEGGVSSSNITTVAVNVGGMEVSQVVSSLTRKGYSTNKNDLNSKAHVDDELLKKPSKGEMKRKISTTDGQKSKVHKSEEHVSVGDVPKKSDLKSKLETPSKELWAIQDDLKKHVTMTELRAMLEANNHSYFKGSEFELRDCCADGMLFGALGPCPICNGPIICSGDQYCCRGHLEWSRCSYSSNSTTEASRLKGKWKVPEETSNEYLTKRLSMVGRRESIVISTSGESKMQTAELRRV